MNQQDYLQFHKMMCDRMVAITAAKNADYGGGRDDPFFNLTQVEKLGIARTEVGILTRIIDKMARITCFLKKGSLQVKDETFEDTILDACNYLLLLAGYLHSLKHKQGGTEPDG